MRMQPIKFRVTYSDDHTYEYAKKGFTSFHKKNENVLAMHVDISFNPWINCGVYMHVKILEDVVPKTRMMDGGIHYNSRFERKVHEVIVYDYPRSRVDAIQSTMEQALLMRAIYNGDIRGKTANDIVNALYVNLVVLEPKSDFSKYLPKVKKSYDDLVKKGYWEKK